jgi:hypothetical protein
VLHLDAQDAASMLLLSGNRVEYWLDQNGGGIGGVPSLRNYTTLGAPVLNAAAINGRPGVDFALSALPTDSRLRHYGSLAGVSYSPEATQKSYTVISVCRVDPIPFGARIIFGVGNNANTFDGFNTTRRLELNGSLFSDRQVGDFPVRLPGPGSDGSYDDNPPEPEHASYAAGFIATSWTDAGTGLRFVTVDGSTVKSVSSVALAGLHGSLPGFGAPQITVGGSPTFGSTVNNRFLPGAVGEIRVWDGVLSPAELAAQHLDLSTKWGVTLLP